jgi:serine protease Do
VPRGALIGSVLKDSPAEKAGLKNGDVIIDFDGQKIIYSGDLPLIVGRIPPEKKVNATIFRDGKKVTVSVTTGKLDEKVAQDTTVEKKEETGNILGIACQRYRLLDGSRTKTIGSRQRSSGIKCFSRTGV